MPHISEYEVEARFIERLESLGYTFAPLNNYDDVLANFRLELSKFNAAKLIEAKGEASFSDAEFKRVLIHVENKSVYESAKILRDKYVLTLDNGKTVYVEFFTPDETRNIYQVTHLVIPESDLRAPQGNILEYDDEYDRQEHQQIELPVASCLSQTILQQ